MITLWTTIKQRLERVQDRDKARVDKQRRDVDIKIGDFVLLATKHLNLKGTTGKLKPRFVGPF